MVFVRQTNLNTKNMKTKNYFSKAVIAASGSLGFIGEGYKHYKLLNFLTLGFFNFMIKNWIVFQSKTTTAFANKGNAELAEDGFSLKKAKPNCVAVGLFGMVNNFSLSGPGLRFFLKNGTWYKINGEFHLSIMLIGKTSEARIKEALYIVYLLDKYLWMFNESKVFLNWNISCPNTGHDAQSDFIKTFNQEYEILSSLELPILVKVGWQFPIEVAKQLQELPWIYGFVAINTIPFNELPNETKRKYFERGDDGRFISPLDKYQDFFEVKGRGGVSGSPIRKYALAWIKNAREQGITKPIIGGGGIMNPYNVWQFKKAGAIAISLGSCISLRFWNLPFIILMAKILFKNH